MLSDNAYRHHDAQQREPVGFHTAPLVKVTLGIKLTHYHRNTLSKNSFSNTYTPGNNNPRCLTIFVLLSMSLTITQQHNGVGRDRELICAGGGCAGGGCGGSLRVVLLVAASMAALRAGKSARE